MRVILILFLIFSSVEIFAKSSLELDFIHNRVECDLHTNNVKNRKFDKEDPQISWRRFGAIFEENPTRSKNDSSSYLCIEQLKHLPVQHEGRIKPLDTVARSALLLLHGSQTLRQDERTLNPTEWLLDVLMNSKHAKTLKLIRVENLDLLRLLGTTEKKREFFSMQDLQPCFKEIYHLFCQALDYNENRRDRFQKAVIVLWQQITHFLSLSNTIWISDIENVPSELKAFEQVINTHTLLGKNALEWHLKRYDYLSQTAHFNVLFPLKKEGNTSRWFSMGEGLITRANDSSLHPGIQEYVEMISAYQNNDIKQFNSTLNKYIKNIHHLFPEIKLKIDFEVLYNTIQPFFLSSLIYLSVIIVSIVSCMIKSKVVWKIAFILFLIGFFIHSSGLITRMIIEGRPPVTNLYSSAVFVGWGAIVICLIIEYLYRNTIGCLVGAIIGSLTLIIAQHFSGNGDTMEVMRAVLNSNFWLSTHVVTITLGYSSTFVAGTLATVFILRGLLTQSLDKTTSQHLSKIVYAIICFSTLLTSIGTILGGFWADQSWGRFWGWDPKENGALLIILWNVLILHVSKGNLVKRQGIMVLTVFGNVVTALSWIGINILGVGLHSYGFMNATFGALSLFIIIQFIIMCLGMAPKKLWRSREAFIDYSNSDI